jgi:hypothetical protein
MTIAASIVADSINPTGNRLTTYRLYYPRCIHSEVMTHRAFSRNSASSRAIPIERMIQRVLDDPFIPRWSAAQPGMTVTEEIDDDMAIQAEDIWLAHLHETVGRIQGPHGLQELGLAKSVVNRLLEPWMHIEVVLSGTEFNNFFALRDDAAAEPHIRELAHMMRELRDKNEPVIRKPLGPSVCNNIGYVTDSSSNFLGWTHEWHLPFVFDTSRVPTNLLPAIKESVAHAAWVSYGNIDGKLGFTQEDVDRVYDKLVGSSPIHASPTEHVAVACSAPHRHGNFTGWASWRTFLPNESGGDYV